MDVCQSVRRGWSCNKCALATDAPPKHPLSGNQVAEGQKGGLTPNIQAFSKMSLLRPSVPSTVP